MAAAPLENPIILDLGPTYGAILIGAYLTSMIWAVSTLQTFLYYMNWDTDGFWKKLFVGALWIVDTVNTGLVLASVWPVLIGQWGKVANLALTRPELIHHGWISALVTVGVQMFFIHRIFMFSKRRWPLPLFLTILAVYQIVCIIPYDIVVFGDGGALSALSGKITNNIAISLRAASAAVDIIVAGVMLYYVLKEGISAYAGTQRLVFRIAIVTANTGFWTAVVALVDLAMLAAHPGQLRFVILEFPICSLYFSSLLANLNSRRYVRGQSNTTWNEPMSFGHTSGVGSVDYRGAAPRAGAVDAKLSQMPTYHTASNTTVGYSGYPLEPAKDGSYNSGVKYAV